MFDILPLAMTNTMCFREKKKKKKQAYPIIPLSPICNAGHKITCLPDAHRAELCPVA